MRHATRRTESKHLLLRGELDEEALVDGRELPELRLLLMIWLLIVIHCFVDVDVIYVCWGSLGCVPLGFDLCTTRTHKYYIHTPVATFHCTADTLVLQRTTTPFWMVEAAVTPVRVLPAPQGRTMMPGCFGRGCCVLGCLFCLGVGGI